MEKSTKDTELEKLQKRVEKLVKANKSLKKDKRNLKRVSGSAFIPCIIKKQ